MSGNYIIHKKAAYNIISMVMRAVIMYLYGSISLYRAVESDGTIMDTTPLGWNVLG